MDIEKIDNELLNHLQSNFPLVEEPFLEIGRNLSISESEVIEKRESKSRPDEGIVTVKTIGKNQDGVEVASFIRSALIPKEGKAVEDKIDY